MILICHNHGVGYFLQPVRVVNLTTEIIMIATITFAFDLDDLLDSLDLELVEEEELDEEYDLEFDIDEDGVIWYFDEDGTDWYYDEDLGDWAEVTEDGDVWYYDEDDVVYYYDEESDEWVEVV
jgi:hypothetical protein